MNMALRAFWRRSFCFVKAQTRGILARCAAHEKMMSVKLSLAEMPQVDHRVRQRFESVVHIADVIESKQQAFEFVFPCKHPLDGAETFFKNIVVENLFSTALGCFSSARILVDVGRHPA